MFSNKENLKIWDLYVNQKFTILKESNDVDIKLSEPSPLTPDQIAAADKTIRLAIHNVLQRKTPFLFHILQTLNVIKDKPDIKTMAVDGVGNIYINRRFTIEELKTKERTAGVLAHEVLHVLNETIERQKWRTHMLGEYSLWNIVTDYVMNAQLLEDEFELPDAGCIPKGGSGNWYIDLEPFGLPGQLSIKNKRCETVYDELLKLLEGEATNPVGGKPPPPGGNPPPPGGGGGMRPGQPDRGDIPRPGRPDDSGQPSNPQGIQQPGRGRGSSPGGWDQHIRGDASKKSDPTPISKEELRKVSENIKKAISDAKHQGIDMKKYLEPEAQAVHDWRAILKKYLDNARKVRDLTKPKTFNLSFGHWKATKRIVKGDHIRAVIAIDTSGSMGAEEIKMIMTECHKLCKNNKSLELRIMLWHDYVYVDRVVDGSADKVFRELSNLPIASGGTKISSVMNTLGDKDKDYSVIIYFTDGCVESPAVYSRAVDSIIILTQQAGDGCVKALGDELAKVRGGSARQRVYKTDI